MATLNLTTTSIFWIPLVTETLRVLMGLFIIITVICLCPFPDCGIYSWELCTEGTDASVVIAYG